MAELNNPSRAPNDGKIGMPSVRPGENKLPPGPTKGGGRGAKSDKKSRALGLKPDEAEDAKILARMRKRFDRAVSAESDNRKKALDDLKFKSGDQWPASQKAARDVSGRPCLTTNVMKTFTHQVTNALRQNRPAIDVSPIGDKGDPEAAEMFSGVIRYIWRHSTADIAVDTAAQSQTDNGLGYIRLSTEYEKPESFNLVPIIKRIRNPFTIYLDPDHQEPDGADCRHQFVTEMMPRDEFEEEFPDADPMPWAQGGIGEKYPGWGDKDNIRLAEYYEIEHEKRTLVALSNGHVGWKDELDEQALAWIEEGKLTIDHERESAIPKVMYYKATAIEIIKRYPWAGKWCPIIKVIGDELDIEGKVEYSGVIRDAKDPQRMGNYWRTAATELVALAPKAPYIGAEGQFEGHEEEWKRANVESFPYLEYKMTDLNGQPAPPPARQPFAEIPTGVMAMLQQSAQDLQATTGIRFDATKNERVTDESGIALQELQQATDLGSYHYSDNLNRSLEHLGRQLIDLIPKVFDTKRVLTILREDGNEERIEIDPDLQKPTGQRKDANGKTIRIFNPTIGEYGVTATIGPSFATRRQDTAKSLLAFAKTMGPEIAMLISDLIAKNMDWPGATELATRLSKVIAQTHPGILAPDMKDVPPQVQAVMMQLQQQVQQLTQERVQMLKQLADQGAERSIEVSKIEKEFEAKLLKIVADVETKMAATAQKQEASVHQHVGSKLTDLAGAVQELEVALSSPAKGDKGASGGSGTGAA